MQNPKNNYSKNVFNYSGDTDRGVGCCLKEERLFVQLLDLRGPQMISLVSLDYFT
jgi:hypothetical protein